MIEKIISGGQTGADIAGLRAAKRLGIPTGGWMPKNCMTLAGPKPDWAYEFNMDVHPGGYKDRTWENVQDSDGTIRFAAVFESPGERCTMNAIKALGKPWLDVNVVHNGAGADIPSWLDHYNIRILNIAGNSERTWLGIEAWVEEFLVRVLSNK